MSYGMLQDECEAALAEEIEIARKLEADIASVQVRNPTPQDFRLLPVLGVLHRPILMSNTHFLGPKSILVTISPSH